MSPAALKVAELEQRVGEEIAVSSWFPITQERIARFADATEDHQWIHVDPEKAARGPFGGTIAHGFLTLSLLPKLADDALSFSDRKMGVNYGLNKLRFTSPVPSGSRVRARFKVQSFEKIAGGAQIIWQVTVEREGADKPALVAEWISRQYW
jgi:acyl dehydratase